MIVRQATAADVADVMRLAIYQFAASEHYQAQVDCDVAQLEKLVAVVCDGAIGAAFVLEAGPGVIVGYLALLVLPNHLSGRLGATEVGFFIEPDYRVGYAWRDLLDAGEAWAQAQGARTNQMVAPAGTRIGRLYQRRGYAELETVFTKRLA